MKPSGVDAMFAKYASEVASAKNKQEMKSTLSDMVKAFTEKMPSESVFIEKNGRSSLVFQKHIFEKEKK